MWIRLTDLVLAERAASVTELLLPLLQLRSCGGRDDDDDGGKAQAAANASSSARLSDGHEVRSIRSLQLLLLKLLRKGSRVGREVPVDGAVAGDGDGDRQDGRRRRRRRAKEREAGRERD